MHTPVAEVRLMVMADAQSSSIIAGAGDESEQRMWNDAADLSLLQATCVPVDASPLPPEVE